MKINTIKNFLMYILVFLTILNCRSVYAHIVNTPISTLLNYFFLIDLIILVILNFKFKIEKRILLFFLLYFLWIFFIIIFIPKINLIQFFLRFGIVFPALIYLIIENDFINKNNILQKYTNFMYILALISLIFYFIGSLFNFISPTCSLMVDWGQAHINGYLYIHFNTQPVQIFADSFYRNTGIFVEAPMYSVQLCLALFFEIFYNKEKSKKKILILILAILSTFSTTGLIITIFMGANYIYKKKIIKKIKPLLLPIIVIITIALALNIFNDKQSTRSYQIREDDIHAVFKTVKNNYLFGSGYMNNETVIQNMSSFRLYNTGLSSAFLIVLLNGGIALSIVYIFPISATLLKAIREKNNTYMLFSFIQILLYLTTAYQYTFLALLVLAVDISYIFEKRRGLIINEKI